MHGVQQSTSQNPHNYLMVVKMILLGFLLFFAGISAQSLQEIHIEVYLCGRWSAKNAVQEGASSSINDTVLCNRYKSFWRSIGSATLDSILSRKQDNGVAKNVIVFVGDGMGLSTVTAARIYQGQVKNERGESNVLAFEKFPAVGLSKTYDVTHQVADSASTATAMFSGVKIRHSVLGLDATAAYNVCDSEINTRAKLVGAMTWAQEKGKDTGIVTTTRITHATPAGTYAHTNNRDWECDSTIPDAYANCVKDIARQLVEDAPGNKFKVIMGGGRQQMGIGDSNATCVRKDGKKLTELWKKGKNNAQFVMTAEELSNINENKTDYLLGLFAPSHLPYVAENDTDRPSLKQMTETAIKILRKNANGFVLLVEGGRIDLAHHANMAKLALIETLEFDEAIATAAEMTNPEETLIIVTADHSHSVVMNGYPKRGNDILGLADSSDKLFYETITYTNGPGYDYHHPRLQNQIENCKGTCSELERHSANSVRDIRNEGTRYSDIYYRHFAGFYREDDTHGGEDVAVYASGPRSHLLVGVYEQNYIGNVISYAACIGPEAHRCKNRKQSSSSSLSSLSSCLLYLLIVSVFSSVIRVF